MSAAEIYQANDCDIAQERIIILLFTCIQIPDLFEDGDEEDALDVSELAVEGVNSEGEGLLSVLFVGVLGRDKIDNHTDDYLECFILLFIF